MRFSVTPTVGLSLALILGAGILLPQNCSADVTKANNNIALTNGASWVLGVAPGSGDIAIFDSTLNLSTNANLNTSAPIGGKLSILGIVVAGPVLGQADGENGIVVTNASSTNTFTIGTSGIDMSAANAVPLQIQSKIALSGSQTWNISDASANITNPVPALPLPQTQPHSSRYTALLANQDEDLYFNTLVAGTPFDLGGFILTLTNTGTTVIDQGYTVGNGVINVTQGTLVVQGGKSRQTTISNNVTINVAGGATLRLQTTSGAIVSGAAINLADGSLLNLTAAGSQGTGLVSNSIAVSGSATISQTQNPIVGGNNNITNVIAANITGDSGATLNLVPSQSSNATCVLQLSGDNSGFNGAINLNAVSGIRPVRLSTPTAGSANASWTVNASNILQVAGVSAALGSLNGSGTISNSTTATTATLNVGGGDFNGTIANAGTAVMALNKITSSTLALDGTNTYTGATAVSNGTLLVNGSVASRVTVYSGGTLGGTGTLRSNLLANAGASLAPGGPNAIGTLTVSGTITNSGGILMEINRTNLQTSDLLSCSKTITITGGGTLTVINLGPALQVGDTFTLFSATGYSGLLGLLNSITPPSLPAGLAWNTLSLTNNGTISVVALPAVTSLTPLNPNVQCSGNATFIAIATGQSPLSYQWSVNNSPVNGQTATNFSLNNIHFPGPITVSVTVSNAYGTVTSNSLITVQDTIGPVLTLNGANPMTVECHGSFNDPGVTANDACAGSVGFQVSGSVDANTAGTYYLTYTADDGNGNTNSVVRTVNVVDTTPPAITYYFTNLVLSADTNCSALMPDVTGTNYIMALDACGGTNLSITQDPTNNTVLPEGTNTVIIAVADQAGNTNYSTNTIVVLDETPPVITLIGPDSVTVECHDSYVELGATATDNCTLASLSTNGVVDPDSPGTYTISYVAVDAAGNNATNTRTVTVADTTPPLITYYFTNLVLSADTNCSALMPDVTGTNYIIASDACGGTNLSITQDPTNNTVLSEGTNMLIIAVTDQSGNTSYSTNTIVVLDETPPVITLNGFSPMTNWVGAVFIDPGATAYDFCAGALPVTTNGVVDSAVPGTYFVEYIATDPANNSATNTRTVYVVAPVPPAISGGTMLNGGNFQLTFSSPEGQPYKVMTTTDLTQPGSWTVISMGVFGAVPAVFTDTNAPGQPVRFYRVVSP